jgi:glycosyltransferase involved in cell wall biosynthesis
MSNQSNRLVSVVAGALRPSEFPFASLQSAVNQTHELIELVCVVDGTVSNGADSLRPYLDRPDVRSRFRRIEIVRRHGPPSIADALNHGIQAAEGAFINVLGSHDTFHRERFSKLLKALDEGGSSLAFAAVDASPAVRATASRESWTEAGYAQNLQSEIQFLPTVGYALLRAFCPISTGNLFFTRRLWEMVGGFQPYQHAYNWDFALRSVLQTEPVYVPELLHSVSLPLELSLSEPALQETREKEQVLRNYLFLCRNRVVRNPYAPSTAWGPFFNSFVDATGYRKYLGKP